MITVRELAEELGVSPQTVRRYVTRELGVATEPRKALQLDADQASIVADHFKDRKRQVGPSKGAEGGGADVATPAVTLENNVAAGVAELRERVAALEAENAGLRSENDLLRERLEVADKALEREQMQARGFWSRLGQKLLGSGKEKPR